MMQRIIAFSVHSRWLVVLLVALVGAFGAYALAHLPIDAAPDITNNQVQINARAPALSAFEMEKQVTYPTENALAGIPGLEYTRSLSRNGFAQVTAVFRDNVDIYFARQQVNERIAQAREDFPPRVELRMGPISTGLSEIYMWTVRYKEPHAPAQDGEPGWQRDGAYLTPEGAMLRTPVEKESYLRTVQDWIIRPQLRTVAGVAGVDSLGGFVKQYHVQPDPAKLMSLGLSFGDLAATIEKNNVSRGAGYVAASIGGRLNVPIYEGGLTSSQVRQAKEAAGQRRFDVDVARADLVALVRANWGALQAAKTQIAAAQTQIAAAERALYGVREEAKAGQRTTLDILNAQQELLNARIALIFAQRERVVASYAVLAAMGRLSMETLHLGEERYDPTIHFDQVRDLWGGASTP